MLLSESHQCQDKGRLVPACLGLSMLTLTTVGSHCFVVTDDKQARSSNSGLLKFFCSATQF